jgi:thiol-disulfide isomerase/thioredoxin
MTGLPPFAVERWVNSPPLSPESLLGKVVLLDIWEYTCVNWIRTAPYVKAWHRTYADEGLVVIGVHAPEFSFGRQPENIDRGIRDHGLTYPIAIDNDFAVWEALGNNAWPAKYLFDRSGRLVGRWIGEGSYDAIEATIRRLVGSDVVTPEVTSFVESGGEPSYAGITPETYVGTARGESGTFRLVGDWQSAPQYVELHEGAGALDIAFNAGEVNLVAQPGASGEASLSVLLDGAPLASLGDDVDKDGVARFDRSGMLRLVSGASREDHVLSLVSAEPGVRAYVFTFGP